jgi:hypothetical protein
MFALGFGCLRAHEHDGPWPCSQHSDCVVGEKCFVRVCVPEKYCEDSTNCAQGQVCNVNECVTGQCVRNYECPIDTSCVAFKCVGRDGG